MMDDVALIKNPLSMNETYYKEVLKEKYPDMKLEFDKSNSSKFYITLHNKDKDGKIIKRGKIGVSCEIMP
jgi:hypothetical protein